MSSNPPTVSLLERPRPDASHVRRRAAARARTGAAAPSVGERDRHSGHGVRLKTAFAALERLPILAGSRERLLAAIAARRVSIGEIVAAVESDMALLLAVLRLANTGSRSADTAIRAVDLMSLGTLQALAEEIPVFDFLAQPSARGSATKRLLLHALATQRAADRIAREVGYENRDRLAVTSLLHDIGRPVLAYVYPSYPTRAQLAAMTPEERIHRERTELVVDHALIGGTLVSHWGLPHSIAGAIERHHSPDAEDDAAVIRLADMLVHYEQGALVSPGEMLHCARAVGLAPERLRRLMHEPTSASRRKRHVDPCPLTRQEFAILQRLGEGMVYKQIAHELALSTSTVRTHLHNIYGKLGTYDRAQTVLAAVGHGWIEEPRAS